MNDRHTPNERIERAIEGRLSAEEWQALQADVIRDPQLRTEYVEQMWLHANLRADRETLGKLLQEAPIPAPIPRRWPMALWAAAAAACVTAVISLTLFPRTKPMTPVATLIKAQNCKWAGSDLPTAEQSKLGVGTLALVEGMATLRFESGATVTLEAPTTLQIINAKHCRLIEGSAVAEVPVPAHGFTIDTPDLKAVDLGTRFGVTAGAVGNSQVYVFEGEVNVHNLAGTELRHLTKGKVYTVVANNAPVNQEPVRTDLVEKPDGWISIPTSYGRGKDGFSRRGNHIPAGPQPLLMVKHTDLAAGKNNERRAFLTFDVSHLPSAEVGGTASLRQPADVHRVQLVLDPKPSGLGFAALVPDSKFAVYGLTDHSLDNWDENKLTWENSPACTDTGLLSDKARKLAGFSIPRGSPADLITIESDDLTQFVRENTNGLATFILVRETGETDQQGLVHAFASREHPNGKPPTLRLK